MIAADSNVLIDGFNGRESPAVLRMRQAIRDNTLALPPPVVAELLSFPVAETISEELRGYLQLDIAPGFWERAADSRRRLLVRGLRARLPDALVAQCCIDADVALLTNDADFRHFATYCGLKLAG